MSKERTRRCVNGECGERKDEARAAAAAAAEAVVPRVSPLPVTPSSPGIEADDNSCSNSTVYRTFRGVHVRDEAGTRPQPAMEGGTARGRALVKREGRRAKERASERARWGEGASTPRAAAVDISPRVLVSRSSSTSLSSQEPGECSCDATRWRQRLLLVPLVRPAAGGWPSRVLDLERKMARPGTVGTGSVCLDLSLSSVCHPSDDVAVHRRHPRPAQLARMLHLQTQRHSNAVTNHPLRPSTSFRGTQSSSSSVSETELPPSKRRYTYSTRFGCATGRASAAPVA